MSITPASMPQSESDSPRGSVPSGPTSRASSAPLWAVLALAVVAVAGLGGLFYYANGLSSRLEQVNGDLQKALVAQNTQAERLQQIAGRLDQADARDTEIQGQVAQTQARIGSAQSELQRTRQQTQQTNAELARQQKEAQEAAQHLAGQLGQLQQDQVATKGSVGNLTTDVAGVRGEVKSTKDDLAATRSELQRVIGDLGVQSDLVAHNRTELEELKLRGERDYVEFDLRRRDRLQRVGNFRLELRRTDPKKQKYTLNLVVDDQTVEKKDKNVYEPVQFYQEGFRAPTEIVVSKIERDRIIGYISAPKKKEDRAPLRKS